MRLSDLRRGALFMAAAAMLLLPAVSSGQTPPSGERKAVREKARAADEEDPLGPPTERGIRLTPEVARTVAKKFVEDMMVNRYELDKAKVDQATELVARRLMAAAHACDEKAAQLFEFAMTEVLSAAAERAENGGGSPVTPNFIRGIGERMIPLLPAIKDLVRGAGQDVMPILPFKQQLKLTRDLVMVGTALNAFEQNMHLWSQGEGDIGANPFEPPGSSSVKKDASGQSAALKEAKASAERAVNRENTIRATWNTYLEDAKKYYGFDPAQCATGDAILREYLERAHTMLQDQAWRQRYYRVLLWQRLIWQPRMKGSQYFNKVLQDERAAALEAQDALGMEFRDRIDEIPTEAQRQAAEQRIMAALAERGYSEEAR